ncbi:hypothetical protein STRAU_2897 [Streptomyces aurantiacus JA 4570]|uniref:Uncharacterized protein n=1 Tax=Streptomyces aurantiacus JA 4570 TaxID=1286094 RepID=S3ZMP5_9ACTN|nr:hypothetical protein STRAU_2897 [Streptomyces aurantiacus JA 4570]
MPVRPRGAVRPRRALRPRRLVLPRGGRGIAAPHRCLRVAFRRRTPLVRHSR